MQRKYIKAFNTLKKMGVPVYVHANDAGNFSISSEEPESLQWADYYTMNREWLFGVHPDVDTVLRKQGLYAEWVNPGRLSVYIG